MSLKSISSRRTLIATAMSLTFLGLASGASAQNLSVQNNQVNITATGFAGAMPTIANDGIVQQVTGVPDQGDGLNVVNFGFTLEQASVPDGSYNFAFGVMLDDDNSLRRLEVKLPTVTMNFSGGTLTGSVAGSQTINAIGRNDDASVQAVATFTDNGSGLTFNGSSLSVNMNSILNLIQASTGNFNNIINSLNEEGHYTYTVALKETTSGGLKFGTGATGTFNQFGCMVGTSVFMLNGNQLAADFDKAFGLQGQLSFTGAGGAAGSAPTAFATSNCLTSSGGGSGGGGGGGSTPSTPAETDPNQSVSDQLNALSGTDLTNPDNVTSAVVEQVTGLVTQSTTNAANVANDSTASVSDGLAAVTTLSSVLSTSGDVATSGTGQSTANLTGSLDAAASVIGSLASKAGTEGLSADQKSQLTTAATELAGNLAKNVTGNLGTKASESVANSLTKVLQATQSASGTFPPALINNVRSVASKLTDAAAADISSRFNIDLTSTTQTALKTKARFRVPLCGRPDKSLLLTDLTDLAAFDVELTAYKTCVSASFLRISQLTVGLTRAFNPNKTVAENLADAIAPGSTVAIDNATANAEVKVGNQLFTTSIIGSNVVPSGVPEGVTVIDNGSALVVSGELGFEMAPVAKDAAAFAAALSSSYNATATFNILNGSYTLANGNQQASVTFAFEDVNLTPFAPGSAGFTAPTGNPADAAYRFLVNYADGSFQSMLPFVAEVGFVDFFFNQNILVETDRSSGVITLSDGRKMKPDYFVQPFSDSLQVYITNNDSDGDGIVWLSIPDANGDGSSDYQIISSAGSQILYTVP